MPEGGWYQDPTGRHEKRYWDGSRWSDHVADGSEAATDPIRSPAELAVAPAGQRHPEIESPDPERPQRWPWVAGGIAGLLAVVAGVAIGVAVALGGVRTAEAIAG